jgi:large subunit ribosomal protein L13
LGQLAKYRDFNGFLGKSHFDPKPIWKVSLEVANALKIRPDATNLKNHEVLKEGKKVRTFTPKAGEVTREWHVIDATDVVLGRLAVQVATLLRGKHKPIFASHVDTGDFVIVINADKVALTGTKKESKIDYRHSGFPGGLRATNYTELLETNPRRAIEKAVKGMLPHNKLSDQQISKLKVYAGESHPHAAQNPKPFVISQVAQ